MKNQPFVSVIIPNYNYARYLKQRIDSVLKQTYTNFELILLDDCSTDNSMEIINQYADNPHVSHIIKNDTNTGSPYKQWWKGISVAKGEIIWIAESDDYCEQDMLQQLVDTYVKHHCVLAFTRSKKVDENDNIIDDKFSRFNKDNYWRGPSFIKKYLTAGCRISNASSAIFSREAALHVNQMFLNYRQCGDWIFWIEIARQGNVAVVSRPLNYFRRSSTTKTAKSYLEGTVDIEDYKVINYLKMEKLGSRLQLFNKKKRMAYTYLYKKDRYADEDIRKKVVESCPLPNIYFAIARISHLFHKLFK